MLNRRLLILLLIFLVVGCAPAIKKFPFKYEKKLARVTSIAYERVNKCITENMSQDFSGPIPFRTQIDTILIDSEQMLLQVHLNKQFSYQPFRVDSIPKIYELFDHYLGNTFKNFDFELWTLGYPVESLVPNYFQPEKSAYDQGRIPVDSMNTANTPLVRRMHNSKPVPHKGLYNSHIALWHSHGFYYSRHKDRWEWQRPRLFNTVEDLLPMSFTVPYIIPMLENAGANVLVPRERDTQTHEVIIDNDGCGKDTLSTYHEEGTDAWFTGDQSGFAIGSPPYPANLNPFKLGTHRFAKSNKKGDASLEWIPYIPETGMYAVYISFHSSPNHVTDAHYIVYHSGDSTEFRVNQRMGGGTWIYLDHFKFEKGYNPQIGKIVLKNDSEDKEAIVSADAVRFGGGMGNIERAGKTSGYPRFAEASRYYLQYAGMPDTLVYNLNGDSIDYNDDYQSRGEYVNYLKGKPFGPNRDRNAEGLNIPIDLSLAFHTDAGIDTLDETIGTLMIYSIFDADTQRVFPDSVSRLASRDLADIMQTQIVSDIRKKYNSDWTRRALMDGNYSEVWRPNVPSCLLELLSHQNFTDMKYALTPQYRFDVSRAIYKAMLRFIATQKGYEYVVQPLPVSHFSTILDDENGVILNWRPVIDPMEPTSQPDGYIVYTRINDGGFDNGIYTEGTEFRLSNLEQDNIYSFKITAFNKGGESFPSEILSVCRTSQDTEPILIVNGFDRVAPPEFIQEKNFKGFLNFLDPGVDRNKSFGFTGTQMNFNPKSRFHTNDAPGHGASAANFETKLIMGNNFDNVFIHAQSFRNNNISFSSSSDEAVMDKVIKLSNFEMVDILQGEEKMIHFPQIDSTYSPHVLINRNFQTFPKDFQSAISEFVETGGKLFISGAYVASDYYATSPERGFKARKREFNFTRDVLKYDIETDHAAITGYVFNCDSTFLPDRFTIRYNSQYQEDIYRVESPDALAPTKDAKTILRYAENRFSAGIMYDDSYKVIAFGFPFETITLSAHRDRVMKAILDRFNIVTD